MISFKQYILNEMPKHYPGEIVYQKSSKFTPISKRNLDSYDVLGEDRGFIFLLHPEGNMGYIINSTDIQDKSNFVSPVMHVSFRDTPQGKQAHHLRIKQEYAQQNLATAFYKMYVNHFGSVVSDTQHLEGGKKLWQSLIKLSEEDPSYEVVVNGQRVSSQTPVEDIWSTDESKQDTVLIFRKVL